MIKLLPLLLIFGSCALINSKRPVSDKMRDCVYELVGQHGVGALKAKETCLGIYKPRISE